MIIPILTQLGTLTKFYHITRGNEQERLYDAPKDYRKWTHPAEAIEIKEKCQRMEYKIEVYADGSKSAKGVCSGIAVFIVKQLTFQLKYRLAEKCFNSQTEQRAIGKVLGKMKDLQKLQGNQRPLAGHADSRISRDAIANPSNHQSLVQRIREETRLENDNWIIHLTWVKAHDDNYGNELADHLAKVAACSSDVDVAYIKIPKSAVTSVLKEKVCRCGKVNGTSCLKQRRINKNCLPHCQRQNINKTANVHKTINDCNKTL